MKINNRKTYQPITFTSLPKEAIVVSEKLIKGKSLSFFDTFGLKEEGVSQVVDFRKQKLRLLERLGLKINGINYISRPCTNENPIKMDMAFHQGNFEIVQNNKGKTFWHCTYGLHRTVNASAGYKILNGEMNLNEAVKWIREQNYFTPRYFPKNYKQGTIRYEKSKHSIKVLGDGFKQFKAVFKDYV